MEPVGNGIGGDLFAIVWDPKSERLVGLNGSGRSPQGGSLAELRGRSTEWAEKFVAFLLGDEGRRIMEFLGLDPDPARLGDPPPGPMSACEGRPGWHRDYADHLEPLRRSLAAAQDAAGV